MKKRQSTFAVATVSKMNVLFHTTSSACHLSHSKEKLEGDVSRKEGFPNSFPSDEETGSVHSRTCSPVWGEGGPGCPLYSSGLLMTNIV